jgi:hypothetical protein
VRDHHNFDVFLLVFGFLLPAQILLLFAWFVTIANKPPVFAEWRRKVFTWGLFAATGVTLWFFAFCVHFLRARESAQRFWLFMNWLGLVVWMFCLAASLTGKGARRILLFAWGIMLFVGVLGIYSASIP